SVSAACGRHGLDRGCVRRSRCVWVSGGVRVGGRGEADAGPGSRRGRSRDLLWATLTVENTNDHEVTWAGSGCRVAGRVEAHPGQPDPGRHWPGTLGTFKDWALQNGRTWAYFIFEEFWNRRAAGGACPAADFRAVTAAKATL